MKGRWACESVRELVELQEILRFLCGVIVSSVRCAQVRRIFVCISHCYEGEVVASIMNGEFGGGGEDLEKVKLRQGSMTPAAALCASAG